MRLPVGKATACRGGADGDRPVHARPPRRRRARHFLAFAVGIACALALSHSMIVVRPAAAEDLDQIVALVNDDVVMRSELDRQIRRVTSQLQQQGTKVPAPEALEKQVLERLIVGKLQLQLADATGIKVDDETLNQAITNIAKQNGVSLTQFRDILEKDGYEFSVFREDIRDEIKMTRLRQREIDNTVTVTDREVDNYLATQKQQGGIESEYHVAHILVATPEGASADQIEETRTRAQSILETLRGGADFEQTAIARSDGQQALQGGDLGWRKASQLPTIFADVVGRMKEGDISELIRSPSGFHIVKLVGERSSGKQQVIQQTHVQHILIKPNELTSAEDARTRLQQLKLRIEGGADFAELARSNSDDRASSGNGGDLGWVGPGDLVPEFEAVMNALQPGQVSAPFTSQFGLHIVRVLDRRTVDGTNEVRRAQAREAIRERKIDEERETWLRRLRDEAYVEYRLPGLQASANPQ